MPSVASYLGLAGIRRIAADVSSVSGFPSRRFIRMASADVGEMALFERANHVARALHICLDRSFPEMVRVLVSASGPPRTEPGYGPMENFRLLAFTRAISLNGAGHVVHSLNGLRELTRRFTSEFDVRPFLLSAQSLTLRTLRSWVDDEDFHVRRLVSECTRTRMPWGVHLRSFQRDPSKVIELIEYLKCDRTRYVQVSVANNLADVMKDNLEYGLSVAERWASTGSAETLKIVRHAVRFPARRGNGRARRLLVLARTAAATTA